MKIIIDLTQKGEDEFICTLELGGTKREFIKLDAESALMEGLQTLINNKDIICQEIEPL